MPSAQQDLPAAAETFFLGSRDTRRVLGGAGETTLWDNWVKRGYLHPVYSGRKALFDYAEVKAFAKRIAAGELAPQRKAFADHPAAIANSIASRRRKAPPQTTAPDTPRRSQRAGLPSPHDR